MLSMYDIWLYIPTYISNIGNYVIMQIDKVLGLSRSGLMYVEMRLHIMNILFLIKTRY